jgi:phosphatidyl-N-methylethanolamine N-methyltransferase
VAVGQGLSASVFHRLGRAGVFYGSAFGYELSWHDDFPFNLTRHPQYVGAVLSIWGFFLVMRFPAPDWLALPLLETCYYAISMRFER